MISLFYFEKHIYYYYCNHFSYSLLLINILLSLLLLNIIKITHLLASRYSFSLSINIITNIINNQRNR